MWKTHPTRRGRRFLALSAAVAVLLLSLLLPSAASPVAAQRAAAGGPCSWWYGIGDSPTAVDVEFAARHYDVIVLNAWETATMRRLRQLAPHVTVLVYKDLASTRNYPGTVDGGVDARYLPTGVGYQAAHTRNPGWFAVDHAGRRVQWLGYPQHWQMAVWDTGYQQTWTQAVTSEVVREGWDGVLADNDFRTLRWYSDAVLAGTVDRAATDRLLRQGLGSMLDAAGASLAAAGKVLVPNISESHLEPGRWGRHARHGGGMDENFVMRTGEGLLTFQNTVWSEMREQAAVGQSWLLLMTHAGGPRDQAARVGFASAALLAGPRTCWGTSFTRDYRDPNWSRYQDLDLGAARAPAVREPSGAWTRRFAGGWVGVNPGAAAVTVQVPQGLVDVDGRSSGGRLSIGGHDARVLVQRR